MQAFLWGNSKKWKYRIKGMCTLYVDSFYQITLRKKLHSLTCPQPGLRAVLHLSLQSLAEKPSPASPPAAHTGKCSLPIPSPELLPEKQGEFPSASTQTPLQHLYGGNGSRETTLSWRSNPCRHVSVLYALAFASRQTKFPFCWLCDLPAVCLWQVTSPFWASVSLPAKWI